MILKGIMLKIQGIMLKIQGIMLKMTGTPRADASGDEGRAADGV